MKNALALGGFLALVIGGGLFIGVATAPGEWYAGLVKPPFNPPNWLFAPAWTALYVLIAVAGWRVWRLETNGAAMRTWWVQLGLNFLWSPVFFLVHQMAFGLIVIVALLATIVMFIVFARRRDTIAAWLFVPYALWVAFASLLNASLLVLN